MDAVNDSNSEMTRRDFVKTTSTLAVATSLGGALMGHAQVARAETSESGNGPQVQTVLGPISPDDLGVTLMHEHAPVIDWSELYGHPIAPIQGDFRQQVVDQAVSGLQAFYDQLDGWSENGTLVEVTPIRVGRYPHLIVDMARKSPVHIVGCTGFWGEALAPMHLWAASMLVQADGIEQVTRLYVKEITEGMEDPYGEPGSVFTDVKAGIIKIATSTFLTALERRANTAAGLACIETGCPISVHTTDGGGLEMARLLLSLGVNPQKIIIGHQGYKDDRENVRATDYHKQLADLGVWVQFDRIGYPNYPVEDRAEYLRPLLDAGYEDQLLLSHDTVPYFYRTFWQEEKRESDWWLFKEDPWTLMLSEVAPRLNEAGIT
ncbi:MAG: twin-arginine translocation signal domain-containing protein, partial [Candidatus Tectomicrobia bacterium]|nr:twin-arginine translocation signal domain-containing protein [Candidatus Tectomicrobia bacterium]